MGRAEGFNGRPQSGHNAGELAEGHGHGIVHHRSGAVGLVESGRDHIVDATGLLESALVNFGHRGLDAGCLCAN